MCCPNVNRWEDRLACHDQSGRSGRVVKADYRRDLNIDTSICLSPRIKPTAAHAGGDPAA